MVALRLDLPLSRAREVFGQKKKVCLVLGLLPTGYKAKRAAVEPFTFIGAGRRVSILWLQCSFQGKGQYITQFM